MKLTPQEEEKLEELCTMSFDMARNNDHQSLETLLKNGLNPNLTNHKGDSLLMLASYHNSVECVKLLLQYKA
ncbi:MAG: ankyrin repeat domain-containing protein, partial [Helicobacter sp.]|nr:ankyrin repeat domain-containing protein [Helicobacter sp.]